ncbi:MAG: division/cell wall cluster transcriptional repressor MraZ [Spirochaetes bacterium]|nr:division/cell wall cluster transcriptional repressor MraZ [Spirochaetota bacterium]
MFKGTSFHTLDEKGRLAIPNKLRNLIEKTGDAEVLIVTQGFEGCLLAYPASSWRDIEKKAEEFNKLSLTNRTARYFIRFFIEPAADCTLDKLGRIMLPQNLREYAKIKKEVVVSGSVDKIEIWAREEWEKFNKTLLQKENEFVEELKNIGL